MTLSITLVRHARSTANDAGVWQGRGDAPLSDDGVREVEVLARRLGHARFDLVVSSDLERTRATAAAVGAPVETDPAWREIDLGEWEGRPADEVRREHPDLLHAIRVGEVGGTGEPFPDFEERANAALDALVERVGSGSVLVVTHGAVIDAIVGRRLGRVPGRRTFPIASNTALTTFRTGDGRTAPSGLHLTVFNDGAHIAREHGFLARMRETGVPIVGFLRHGVTAANKQLRIQGQTGPGLDDEGRDQVRRFVRWYGPVDRVVTSPLERAVETAALVGNGRRPDVEPLVQEMAFGDWEGLGYHELIRSGDELAARVFVDGEDLPRGGSGESYSMLVGRVRRFLEGFDAGPGERTLVVSHGAAIRALLSAVAGEDAYRPGIATSANTGITHVAFTPDGPMVGDYGVAPHLDPWFSAEPEGRP